MQDTFFVFDKIYGISKIPLRYISADGNVLLHRKGYEEDSDPVLQDLELRNLLMSISIEGNLPRLYVEKGIILHASFWDHEHQFCVLVGPVSTRQDEKTIHSYGQQHKVTGEFKIRQRNMDSFLSTVCMLYYSVRGEFIQESQIKPVQDPQDFDLDAVARHTHAYMMDNAENEFERMSYHDEQSILNCIRYGNVEEVTSVFGLGYQYLSQVPLLAKDQYKHYEYMVCSAITLATRASIMGGVDTSTAYAMSDLYLRDLERCQTIKAIFALQKSMMVGFATKVREINQRRSQHSVVEKAKNYIRDNVNRKFSLEDIAQEVHVSKSHLSRLFSKEVGIGIGQYTQKMRIETACDMLKYSQASISQISAYLCFPSHSHFGKVFKEHTGMTPQQYRNQESIADITSI